MVVQDISSIKKSTHTTQGSSGERSSHLMVKISEIHNEILDGHCSEIIFNAMNYKHSVPRVLHVDRFMDLPSEDIDKIVTKQISQQEDIAIANLVNAGVPPSEFCATDKVLLDYVKSKHGEQMRKYSKHKYWTHPYAVAKIVSCVTPYNIPAALLHDLVEDTDMTLDELADDLHLMGYASYEVFAIKTSVSELTNVFTGKSCPGLNRAIRKTAENHRLGTVSGDSQTIKYADIIHNVKGISKYDPKFASLYIEEKITSLEYMTDGNDTLRDSAMAILLTEKITYNN